MFAPDAAATHQAGSLQNADASLVQLEGVLKTTQLNLSIFRAPPRTHLENRLRLLIEDSYEFEEPMRLRVRPESPLNSLEGTLVSLDTSERRTVTLLAQSNGLLEAQIEGLSRATYRVTVSGPRPVVPISDLFVVA